jgi:uncharacterized protein YndB with AHSA1/START domain
VPEVTRSIDIAAPPSAVWQWLATPDALRQWLSPSIEIDLQVGGSYRMREVDTWISGRVLEIVPEGCLILSWIEDGGDWIYPGRLLIALTPTPHGTRVTLSHDGFAGIGKSGWRNTMEAYDRGADRHRILDALAALATGTRGRSH